nr:PQQ-dependent sugar dehydrogenase [Nocardioides luti]
MPDRFRDQVVIGGLDQPTAMAFAPDGRVFVAEKTGVIKVFDGLDDTDADVFADLNVNVENFYDRGLLGLTLDPEFPARPYVYVSYAYNHVLGDPAPAPRWGEPGQYYDDCPDPPGADDQGCVVSGRVSRLTADGNQVTGEEQVLVEDYCLQFPSHATGTVAFGPDGALYASAGEGANYNYEDYGQTGNPCGDPVDEGGALRAQDLRTGGDPVGLNGTVIRIDPDTGLGAPGNPLASSPDLNARRIIADGFRNPFRFAFRPGTSQVVVGDVGSFQYEELNTLPTTTPDQVVDFGWPCYEGAGRNPGWDVLDKPVCEDLYAEGSARSPTFQYDARGGEVAPDESCPVGSSAISGVAFPTASSYPARFRDALVFSDYARGCIWALGKKKDGSPDPGTVRILVEGASSPVNLVTGPGGDLFYAELGVNGLGYPAVGAGAIHRIHYYRGNQPPVVDLTTDRVSGPLRLAVQLDASGSTDPDGDALSYAWDLDGDGQFDDATGAKVTRTFTREINYRVGVRVSDPSGASDTALVTVYAGDTAPTLTVASPAASLRWSVGQSIHLEASATDPEEDGGVVPEERMAWHLTIRHCPAICHSHPTDQWIGQSVVDVEAPDHEYPSYLLVTASATDSRGLTTTRSIQLSPRKARLGFTTKPVGLRVSVAGARERAPLHRTFIRGGHFTLSAPKKQRWHGHRYRFVRWSDGRARTHVVVAEPGARDYRAVYRRVR